MSASARKSGRAAPLIRRITRGLTTVGTTLGESLNFHGGRIAKQGLGKIRRLASVTFRMRAVEESLKRRRGQCARCGACCRLLMRCPLLGRRKDGGHFCRIYRKRPAMCRLFPLDERCIAERDRGFPGRTCGYSFVEAGAARGSRTGQPQTQPSEAPHGGKSAIKRPRTAGQAPRPKP